MPEGPAEQSKCEVLELELRNLQDRLSHLEVHLSKDDKAPTAPSVPEDAKKKEDGADHSIYELQLDESIWSIAVVIGLEKSFFNGFFDFFVAAILAVIAAITQIAFIVILLSDIFRPFKDQVADARAWRSLVAHDAKFQDLSGSSLVSRACLDSSGLVGAMIQEINLYLGLGTADFEMPGFRPGTLASVLCILLWSVCVMKEIRRNWLMVQAVFWLPRSWRSALGEKMTISCRRAWILMFLYGFRSSIGILLLIGGIRLLGETTSPVQMVLITAALPMILNVDKQFFTAMMPMEIKLGIQRMKPFRLHYGRMHSQIESFVAIFFVLAVLLVSYSQVLAPLEQKSLDTKMELCAGQQTFVVSHNPASQLTYAMKTDETLESFGVAIQAVENYKFSSASSYMIFTTAENFQTQAFRSMREEASLAPCWEAGNTSDLSTYQITINAAALALGSESSQNCSDLAQLCHEPSARLLRMACGVTCGCSEPRTAPWYKVEAQGCSSACLASASAKATALPCQDIDKSSQTWVDLWDDYIAAASAFVKLTGNTADAAALLQTVQKMKSEGCSYLQQEEFETATGAKWCEGHPDLFWPLTYLCPASCGGCR